MAQAVAPETKAAEPKKARSAKTQRRFGSLFVNGLLLFLVLLWTIPTIG